MANDTPYSADECIPLSSQHLATAWRRIGTLNLLILLLGTAFLLVPLALLGWMWRESTIAISGGKPGRLWMEVIHASWMSRLVTVCTAGIRATMALQAGLITAMVSSIILERIGSLLSHAPFYSIIRAISVNPINLLSTIGIRLKSRSFLLHLVSVLVIIEVLVTVSSQFLSTILISDFRDGTFTDIENSTNVGIFSDLSFWETAWWKMPPASSWTFGELPGGPSGSLLTGQDFHDTGHTYRAFIPFEDEAQRRSLRKFHGPASVIDHRVSTFPLRLSGQIAMGNRSHPMLKNTATQQPVEFECALPYPSAANSTHGTSSLCYPHLGKSLTIHAAAEFAVGDSNPMASTLLIILDIVDPTALLFANSLDITTGHQVTTVRDNGPWAILNNGSDAAEALRISTCFTNLVSRTFTVSMNSSWQGIEPKIPWNRATNSYDTEQSRRQLGASLTAQNLSQRGVLALAPKSEWSHFDMAVKEGEEAYQTYWHFAVSLLGSLPIPQLELTSSDSQKADPGLMLSEINTADTSTADRSHVGLFQDTLQDTDSPALALQTLITRGTQKVYYENLARADPTEPALTAFSSTALIPVRWAGFIAGVSLITTHFVILVLITALFVMYTENSFLGNYWQAIAQLLSKDTLPILDQVSTLSDKEVKHLGKYEISHLQHRSFLRRRRDGRVAIEVKNRAE
ncbi:hypothetical protein BJX76DRAFT_368601 [Aspergillus varians]